MSAKKFVISGYYGFDNFGDDAILHVIVSDLKEQFDNPKITVISNNPDKIRSNYKTDSIYKFDFKSIVKSLRQTDVFISGGGSLLQDVTSLNSLLYYLSLIFMAKFFNKQVFIYAQGIGPINNSLGKLFTKLVLLKVNFITVRDEKSRKFLEKMGIKSCLTSDPVWSIKTLESNKFCFEKSTQKQKVGIQLRDWHTLDEEKLENLIYALKSTFNSEDYQFILFSLQDSMDLNVTEKFKFLLEEIMPEFDVELYSNLSVFDVVSLTSQLDYLIAMRFHACLVSLRFSIPTFAISYDPKVETLAVESGIPYVSMSNMKEDQIKENLKKLLDKDKWMENLKDFSAKKELDSRQNIDLLLKLVK